MPSDIPQISIGEAIEGADVVMMLRVQRERLEEDLGDAPGRISCPLWPHRRQASGGRPDAVIMHPGPINRGVEIESAIADDPRRSLISLQVEMGVAVRMACLEMLVREFGLIRRDLDRRIACEFANEAFAAIVLQLLAP